MRSFLQVPSNKLAAICLSALPLLPLSNGCGQSSGIAQVSPAIADANSQGAQGAPADSPARVLKGHADMILSLAFSRDGKSLATASADKTVKLWDVGSGQVRQTLTGNRLIVWSAGISPNGKEVASAGNDSSMRIWDAQSGRPRNVVARGGVVSTVAFSPDGKLLASGGRAGWGAPNEATLNIWDAGSGKLVRALTADKPLSVHDVTFSADGKLLLSGGIDKTLRLWDVKTGRLQRAFSGNGDGQKSHHGDIEKVALSPDGALAAGGGWDNVGTAWVWNARTGALLHTLRQGSGSVSGLAFSPDGKTLALATRQQVQLCDAQTGKPQKSWQVREAMGVKSLAFTPDGKYLVTGSSEDAGGQARSGTISFWPVR